MRAPSASGCCPGESNGRCENCPPENLTRVNPKVAQLLILNDFREINRN